MSDHAKPAEIEDVLSSIRRLVSGGVESPPQDPPAQSPEEAARNAALAAARAAVNGDALVLTPSLLVETQAARDAQTSEAESAWDADAAAESEAAQQAEDEGAPALTPEDGPIGEVAHEAAGEEYALTDDEDDASLAAIIEAATEPAESSDVEAVTEPAESPVFEEEAGLADARSAEAARALEAGPTPEAVAELEEVAHEEVAPEAAGADDEAAPNLRPAPEEEDAGGTDRAAEDQDDAPIDKTANADVEPFASEMRDGADQPGDEAKGPEARKSPFLSESLVARRAAERPEEADAKRTGFGFAGARRDDPVRHVPLSALGPAKDVADDPAQDSASSDEITRTGEREEIAAEAPGQRAAPIISPGFAVSQAPASAEPGEPRATPQTSSEEQSEGSTGPRTGPQTGPQTWPQTGLSLSPEGPEDERTTEDALAPGLTLEEDAFGETGDTPDALSVASEEAAEPQAERRLTLNAAAPDAAAKPNEDMSVEDAAPSEPTRPMDGAEEVDRPSAAVSSPEVGVDTHGAETEGLVAGDSEDGALNVFGEDAFGIDEQALREIIAQVVHEELQGALGERVSRNIRLLIRREIARALENGAPQGGPTE
ncbi:MAG: hypothetical protein AAF646_02800 [Pseudomonadota bacterium]